MSESLKRESDSSCPFCTAGWPVTFCLERPGEGCLSELAGQSDDDTTEPFEAPTGAQEAAGEELLEAGDERVYKDARSTGRKRAAKLYGHLVNNGSVCEWAWKKHCGGGIVPIIGCTGRPAEHIHHGPDKSTFNNERSNISLVCEYCHNRWHALNDPHYEKERPANGAPYLPRIPEGGTLHLLEEITEATREEVFANELMYPVRGKDKG